MRQGGEPVNFFDVGHNVKEEYYRTEKDAMDPRFENEQSGDSDSEIEC